LRSSSNEGDECEMWELAKEMGYSAREMSIELYKNLESWKLEIMIWVEVLLRVESNLNKFN